MQRFLSVATLLFLTITATAQSIQLGFQGGAQLSNYRAIVASTTSLKSRIGYTAGFLAEFQLTTLFSVQPELSLATYGVRLNNGDDKVKYNQHYIVLPLLLKFNTTEGLSVFLGPQAGMMVGANAKNTGDDEAIPLKEYLRETDFFVVAGVEYRLNKNWRAGVRYNHGLLNINRSSPEYSTYNRGIGIYLTHLFTKTK